ncbi:hypothetical protein [Vibrio sonorensis]|uniref:hypothetical protein n=1 Tax=Vibrio sonorensis TaxID=1004316 RepID=UPI0008D9FCB6|nr:hypothetical protein [Vibrio sonorensis]
MANLLQTLEHIGVTARIESLSLNSEFTLFCEQNSRFFTRITTNDQSASDLQRLLGLLTKSHIEALTSVEQNMGSLQAMEETFLEHLGDEHKFQNHSVGNLLLITHLWVYLQGYLQMDFSLANDYAEQTAQRVAPLLNQQPDRLRTELMKSFYLGDESSPTKNLSSQGILARIKQFFS